MAPVLCAELYKESDSRRVSHKAVRGHMEHGDYRTALKSTVMNEKVSDGEDSTQSPTRRSSRHVTRSRLPLPPRAHIFFLHNSRGRLTFV